MYVSEPNGDDSIDYSIPHKFESELEGSKPV